MSAEKFDSELNQSAVCGKVYNRKESQKQPMGDKDQSEKSYEQRVQIVSLIQLFYVTYV